MDWLLDLLKEFDINNIWFIMIVSIILISGVTGYVQLFHASRIEMILMNKSDELKRISFVYIILLFMFGIINYIFTINIACIVVNVFLLMLTILVSTILRFFKSKGIATALYQWCEERKNFVIILTSTAIITFTISKTANINLISCSILGALVEVIIVAMTIFDTGDVRSVFVLSIENEKWYVFKRMNEEYLLCGNDREIKNATKIKLLSIDYIVEQKLCFEKSVEVND